MTSPTPIRTSAADRNWLSLNATSIVWFAGTDEVHEGELPYPLTLAPDDPTYWSSSLKCSGRTDTRLSGIRAAQCMENVIDINSVSHDLAFEGRFGLDGLSSGDQVVTIKGGSHHIAIKGTIYSKGRKADITVGAWSDQSTAPTHHLDLSLLKHATARPLTVILGRVNSPLRSILLGHSSDIALPEGARIKVWASLGELAYWHLKRLYVFARYHRW